MNLYKIQFTHYSQKDSRTGIQEYLIAKNDEEVFNYLKKYITYWDDLFWDDEDSQQEDLMRDFKERIIACKGDMNDEETLDNLCDLYYGATLYGWEHTKDLTSHGEASIVFLKEFGIDVEMVCYDEDRGLCKYSNMVRDNEA